MSEVLQFGLRAGIEEGADPKALPPGTLSAASNVYQDKYGRVRKRSGTDALDMTRLDAGSVAAGARILTRGKDLGVIDGETAFVYSEQVAKWQPVDRPANMRVTKRPLVDATRSSTQADCAAYQHLLVTVYLAGDPEVATAPLFIQVEDVRTGVKILPPTLAAAAAYWPRVVVRDGIAIVVYHEGTEEIRVVDVDLTTMAVSAEQTVFTNSIPFTTLDAMVVGDELYIAYEVDAASGLRVVSVDGTYTTSIGPTDLGASGTRPCLHVTAGEYAHVAYQDAGVDAALWTLDAGTLAVVAGPTVMATLGANGADFLFVARDSATQVVYGYCNNSVYVTEESLTTFTVHATTHAVAAASERTTWSLYAPSKPWKDGERWYCLAVVLSHGASSLLDVPPVSSVVVEIRTETVTNQQPPHRHVATLENQTGWYGKGWIDPTTPTRLPLTQPAIIDGTAYVAAAFRVTETPDRYRNVAIGFNVYAITASADDAFRPLLIGPSALGVAGAPFIYDGASTMPAGFIAAPLVSAANNATNGGPGAGVYQYVAVYEWRDANGMLHRSAPSAPYTFTVTTKIVDVTITCATLSGKQIEEAGFGATSANPVRIALYRTTVGGDTFYRLTLEPLSNVVFNDPLSASVVFSDNKTDAKINEAADVYSIPLNSRPQLYIESGELEDISPPAFVTACVHRGRVFGIGPDLRTLYASKDITEDQTVFPGFNEALSLAFDADKTALASLDATLIVFSENGMDVVSGPGPDATGDERDWAIARVQSDVGCINPRSTVTTPVGVMFESMRGIEVVTRGLEVNWIGRSVDDTLAAYPTITSAVLVPNAAQVRFTCNAADGLTGIVLVYDYVNKAWYSWTYYDTVGLVASQAFVDAALVDGVYTLLTATGQVLQEDASTCLDGGAQYVTAVVEFAWISPAGALSCQYVRNVQLLGTALSEHELTLQVGRDYATTFEQTKVFAGGSAVTTTGPLEKAQITPKVQELRAIKLRVSDATPGGAITVGTGAGFQLEGIALEVDREEGMPRLSAGRKG